MNGDSDEALMIAYAQGQAVAFEQLYARWRQPLYAYFRRHAGDEATANDLYQGCWEKVIGARRRYRHPPPFRAWLFRIAHNHLVDHWRAQKPSAPLPPGLAADEDHPGESLDEQARQARFRAAVDALPDDQREAIVLRLEAGLGVEQIAEVTGVGVETAKSRLRYATRKLKEALQS